MILSPRYVTALATLLLGATSVLEAQPLRLAIGQSARPARGSDRPPRPSAPVIPPAPPLPSGVAIPEAKLDRLIEDLNSGIEPVAFRAERRLLRGGPSAVKALQQTLTGQPDYALSFVPDLLTRFVRESDEEASEAAAAALTELTQSEQPEIQSAAEEALDHCRVRLRNRAIARIREMGGIVKFSRDFYEVDDVTGELFPAIAHISIDEDWSGGADGLKEFERLSDLRMLYLIVGHPLSDKILERLKQSHPELRIENRGKVRLGIAADQDRNEDRPGVRITMIAPAGSAHRAGLKADDRITSVDGKRTESFPELVEVLQKYSPGDVIKLTYVRPSRDDQKEIETEVTLQGWISKR